MDGKETKDTKDGNQKDLETPEDFHKLMNDFTNDIILTFPEYEGVIRRWYKQGSELDEEKRVQVDNVFKHCVRVYPERFFDILYRSEEIFKPESDVGTEFLPGIVFKHLWHLDISEATKDAIWKYLQAILMSAITSLKSNQDFGDAANLFEAINEDELKEKLQETLASVQQLFANANQEDGTNANANLGEGLGLGPDGMPNVDELHKHLEGLLEGKLGRMAFDVAQEAITDLDIDLNNLENNQKGVNKMFQQMYSNPTKLINTIQKMGSKLDEKIKSGELKQSEIMEEGMEMLNKLKSMPGMGNMQKVFEQMGMPGLGKGGKMNFGAMESQLNRNLKSAKSKERMRAKLDAKKASATPATLSKTELDSQIESLQNMLGTQSQAKPLSDEELFRLFGSDNANKTETNKTETGKKTDKSKKKK